MKSKRITVPLGGALLLASLWLAGCGGQSESTESGAVINAPESQLEAIWMDSAPEDAIAVTEARNLEPGDSVVVTGVIGGVMHPFTEGFATFVLGDDAIVFCNEMGDDHCATPWDACCEDRDVLAKSRAMVQVLDADGTPLAQGLRQVNGLVELSKVTVIGVVADQSTQENLIINAAQIHVKG